jgi:hypothetical protein
MRNHIQSEDLDGTVTLWINDPRILLIPVLRLHILGPIFYGATQRYFLNFVYDLHKKESLAVHTYNTSRKFNPSFAHCPRTHLFEHLRSSPTP